MTLYEYLEKNEESEHLASFFSFFYVFLLSATFPVWFVHKG